MGTHFINEYTDIVISSRKVLPNTIFDELGEALSTISEETLNSILNELAFDIMNSNGITLDQKIKDVSVIEEGIRSWAKDIGASAKSTASNVDATTATMNKIGNTLNTGLKIGGTAVGILGGAAVAALIISRIKKSYKERKYGVCSKFKHKELAICRLNILDVYIQTVKSRMKDCNKSSSPAVCKEKLQIVIDSFEDEKNKWSDKLYEYQRTKQR
jgi:hypothetical protein